MNRKFHNAIMNVPQACPPIWFMRQAGRYHRHYQALRARHSFMELCRRPELAAETAMGPIRDFDFDVAILFSDLLFPLEALGMGLSYENDGPKLGWSYTPGRFQDLLSVEAALPSLLFQKEALQATRAVLPGDKSLLGFVGAPWTLFVYAVEGAHGGALTKSKKWIGEFPRFCERLLPLLEANISLQLSGGAELVMLFDTAAGELSPAVYNEYAVPALERLARKFPRALAYYSKGTNQAFFRASLFEGGYFAGLGFDHRLPITELLSRFPRGFVQGNFDQALLHAEPADFERFARVFLEEIYRLPREARSGWVAGLGHGVLPQTPEENVRSFVALIRSLAR